MSKKQYEQLEILQDPDRKPKRKRKLGPIYIPWRWVAGSFVVGAALVIVTLVALFGIRPAPLPVIPDALPTSGDIPALETPLPIPTLTGGGEFLRSLSWVNGRLAAAGSNSLRVYEDTIAPGSAHWMQDYGESANRVFNTITLSPDGTQLAGIVTLNYPDREGGTSEIAVWDAQNGSLLRTFQAHIGGAGSFGPGGLDEIIYTPDSTRMITSAGDGQAIIWDATTFQELATLETGGIATLEMAFQPDSGNLVLVSGTGMPTADLQIWDVDAQQMIRNLPISGSGLYQVALSPDAHYAAVQDWTQADGWFISIWDVQRGEQLGAIPIGEIESIHQIAVDKNLLALSGFVGQHIDEASGETIDTHREVRALRWQVDEQGTFQYERIGAKEDFLTASEIRELSFTTDAAGTWLNYITGTSGSSLQRWNLTTGSVEALPFW
jgi:WD40 repeat protein